MSNELSLLATVLVFISFLFSISDVFTAKSKSVNGAIKYMTLDNVRHQVCLLVLILLIIGGAPMSYACSVIIFDALFTFFRRRRMAVLVADYIAHRGQQEIADAVRIETTARQLATDVRQRAVDRRQQGE